MSVNSGINCLDRIWNTRFCFNLWLLNHPLTSLDSLMVKIYAGPRSFLYGYKTLWWNQRVRLQKLQSSALSQMRFKGPRYSGIFKGSPKQAVCPFCFKVFYDKSTMNRHVSKRVCLGLQFPPPDFPEDTEMVSEISLSGVESPIRPSTPSMSIEPISSEMKVSDDRSKLSSPENKSNKIPCPYCKKLMKGERGVRKHIDFYGCPMAFGSKVDNEDD